MSTRHLIIAAFLLVLLGIVVRFLPHLPNMTPITAIAIVSSMYLRRHLALILPLGTLFLSDSAIGFYEWRIMLSVYGSFALIALMSWYISNRPNPLLTTVKITASSFIFFLITNAAVWAFSPWYEKSIAGLLYAYELGIPFFRNMFIGDLLYTFLFITAFEIYLLLNTAHAPLRHRFLWRRVGDSNS
jgi:hypothetical protein